MREYRADKPLRVMFLVTSLPVGGAETLLANLVRRMDRTRFAPEIACLKDRGPLGDELSAEFPVHCRLIHHKFDVLVLWRLWRMFRSRQIDVVVTVGAGDKMFWGRLGAKLARVPVILSALHSTGWPDEIGKLNRLLTPITDGFIGVASNHSKYLVEVEKLPASKVHTIYNGIDTERFQPNRKRAIRSELGIPDTAKVVAILAALRPEKNHRMFLEGAAEIRRHHPEAWFVVIGDGPLRATLETLAAQGGVADVTRFLGSCPDVDRLLPAADVLALTSLNEASPVSLLEGLSCGIPAVAPDVGSISETLVDGTTGRLFSVGDKAQYVQSVLDLLANDDQRRRMGEQGRRVVVETRSLEAMVAGYEALIERLYVVKTRLGALSSGARLVAAPSGPEAPARSIATHTG